jgi:CRP-like cAMP-binding protein
VDCEEYAWRAVEERMREHPELRMTLEHMARERLYGVIMATHPLFSLLDRNARKRLFGRAMVRMQAPGERLIEQGGAPAHLYLVASGRLRIERDGQLLCRRGRGDIVGEMSVFGFSSEPTADVVAEDMAEVIEFGDRDVMEAARGSGAFQRKLADICRERLLEIMRREP